MKFLQGLKGKLILWFFLVGILVLASGLIGIYFSGKIADSASVVSKEKAPVQYAANKAGTAVSNAQKLASDYLSAWTGLDKIEAGIEEELADISMWVSIILHGTEDPKFIKSPQGMRLKKKGLKFSARQSSKKVQTLAKEILTLNQNFTQELNELKDIQREFAKYSADLDGKIYALDNFMYMTRVEHVVWYNLLSSSVNIDVPFTKETDPLKVKLGKWLSTYQAEDEAFAKIVKDMVKYQGKVFKIAAAVAAAANQNQKYKSFRRGISSFGRFDKGFDKAIDFVNQKYDVFRTDKAVKVKALEDLADKINVSIDKLSAEIDKEVTQAVTDADSAQTSSTTWLMLVTLIAMAFAIAMGFMAANKITKPINQVVAALINIVEAEGDLTKRFPVRGNDELAEMAKWFNTFMDKLEEIIRKVNQSARTLVENSLDVSSKAEDFERNSNDTVTKADGAADTGKNVRVNMESVAAAVAQLQSSISEIARNTQESASVASEAFSSAEATGATMISLGESSNEIGGIVNEIVSIAEQTNLLALNATIEAARAGDAGKGFAVVANEVKELAGQTGQLTEKVGGRVSSIQTSTKDSMSSIEQICQIVDKLNNFSSTIAGAVEEQGATTSEIGRSITEATSGVRDISDNLDSMAEAARCISTEAAETKVAIELMKNLANDLLDLVGRFQVREESEIDNTSAHV